MLYSPLAYRFAHFACRPAILRRWTQCDCFNSVMQNPIWPPDVPRVTWFPGPIDLTASPAVWTATVAFQSQYWDVTRRLLLCDKLRRSPFTRVEVVCGCKTDVCKHGWNLDFPCRNSWDVSYQFYLVVYWYIDLFTHFWERKKIISKKSATPETSKAAHTPTCTQ